MDATHPTLPLDPLSAAAVASNIRQCVATLTCDLETVRTTEGGSPPFDEALLRAGRQVVILARLANKLHTPARRDD